MGFVLIHKVYVSRFTHATHTHTHTCDMSTHNFFCHTSTCLHAPSSDKSAQRAVHSSRATQPDRNYYRRFCICVFVCVFVFVLSVLALRAVPNIIYRRDMVHTHTRRPKGKSRLGARQHGDTALTCRRRHNGGGMRTVNRWHRHSTWSPIHIHYMCTQPPAGKYNIY